jgi:DNA-binding transcriptional ArsR family regulator
MSKEAASLHKILKDETRQKIILLLNEKRSLGYTELLDATEVGSTGRLNYHLKVLSELLQKNENGQYSLTEKGKLASQLIVEFPDKKVSSQTEVHLSRRMVVVGIITYSIFATGFLALYVQGVMNLSTLLLNELIATGFLGIFLVSLILNKIGIKLSIKPQLSSGKIFNVVFWALVCTCAFMICGSFILYGFQTLLQSIGVPFVLFPFRWWGIISFTFGPVIGGYVGYLLFRRHQKIKPTV